MRDIEGFCVCYYRGTIVDEIILALVRARCSEMVNCSRILLESFTAKKANEIFDTRDSVK